MDMSMQKLLFFCRRNQVPESIRALLVRCSAEAAWLAYALSDNTCLVNDARPCLQSVDWYPGRRCGMMHSLLR